jgi:quinol monooxygenase YgiN
MARVVRVKNQQEVTKMALGILAWDLPPADKNEMYLQSTQKWIATVLKQPGVKEFRAYRNPFGVTPQIVTHTEFDSMASWLTFLQSEKYTDIVNDLRNLGCANITAEVLETSPLVPEPLKPSGK